MLNPKEVRETYKQRIQQMEQYDTVRLYLNQRRNDVVLYDAVNNNGIITQIKVIYRNGVCDGHAYAAIPGAEKHADQEWVKLRNQHLTQFIVTQANHDVAGYTPAHQPPLVTLTNSLSVDEILYIQRRQRIVSMEQQNTVTLHLYRETPDHMLYRATTNNVYMTDIKIEHHAGQCTGDVLKMIPAYGKYGEPQWCPVDNPALVDYIKQQATAESAKPTAK